MKRNGMKPLVKKQELKAELDATRALYRNLMKRFEALTKVANAVDIQNEQLFEKNRQLQQDCEYKDALVKQLMQDLQKTEGGNK